MSTKTDYDSEEWKSISAAPVAAGLMIILSDARDPVGVTNAMTVGNAITQSARGDLPDFVKALVETVTRQAGGPGSGLVRAARRPGRRGAGADAP